MLPSDPVRRPDDQRPSAAEQARIDDAALAGAKDQLRRAVRTRRDSRTEQRRIADDSARTALLRDFLGDPGALTVALYLSVSPEPDTTELIAWLHTTGARVLLPVLGRHPDGTPRRRPDWAEYAGPEQLRLGYRDIPEPTTPALGEVALLRADVIIAPALAATTTGDRLGTGGGWYDRALTFAVPGSVSVALLNEDEVLAGLPVQSFDRRVDVLATPTRLIRCEPVSPPEA
ncbi:5-formyltetrahydrofolate cyclo-ligase [Granulicoccus phenolivorans]|uniref:5-formyltetrahydrofolate cyclo-ligase n=1 Tax=Granulicoccus phenolivorans TaxID=266854 RepID=UPI000427D20D|nr:5-formyltetrahydrofolate cyclo-ligase [Granulicoccus phenolivorans]